MNNPNSMQYLMDRQEPSNLFLEARQIAGVQLQEQFSLVNQLAQVAPQDAFRWIKAELTYPAFEHLTFAYKKSIFAVIIEVRNGNESSLTDQQVNRLQAACLANNLIACVFVIEIDDALAPANSGWNLIDPQTREFINPVAVAEDGPVEMSAWEMSNFSIQVVRDYLEKQGNEVLSFCDLPEVNPQVWFQNSDGQVCWLIVQNTTTDTPLLASDWLRFEESNPALKPYSGYFAAVRIKSMQQVLFRGAGMMVDFKGIEKIYDGED